MMNCITLMGRLTADPVLTVATSGTEICRFRIAVDRAGPNKVADFIPIICFGSSANFVEKWFRKGSMIAVQGKLQTGSYIDKKGVRRSTFEVAADELSFCGEKRGDKPSTASGTPSLSGTVTGNEGLNEYFSTALPGDFDEIVGDEEYE